MFSLRLGPSLLATAAVGVLCACASKSLSPTSPETVTPGVSVTSVSVGFAAERGASIRPGEVVQLKATAAYSDNTTSDCSATATWSSSNDQVLRLTGVKPGEVIGVTNGDAKVTATCGAARGDLAAFVLPLDTTGPGSDRPGIRISGFENYPNYVLVNSLIRMHAAIIDGDGNVVRDCTSEAVWDTSDRTIARPSNTNSSLGRSFVQSREGEVTITASCVGLTGQVRVRIGHFTLNGSVRSTSGEPVSDALIGLNTRTAGSGSYLMDVINESPTITVSRLGFDTHQSTFAWNRQPVMLRDISLTPLPDIFRQGEGRICPNYPGYECEAGAVRQDVIAFTVPRNGNLRLATHWEAPGGSSVDHDLIVTLTCNGVKLPGFTRYVSSGTGGGFTVAATTTCNYELTIQNGTTLKVLPYQWTLNMQ